MTLRPCLACGEPTGESRCTDCTLPSTKPRDRVTRQNRGRWKRLSKRLRQLQPWCSACGATADLTVDHRVPLEDGGDPYDLDNLDVLCRPCNSRKGSQGDAPTTWGGTPPEPASPTRRKAQGPSHTPGGYL